MKKLATLSALALCLATPAFAQDESDAPSSNFDGFSLAAIGGLDVLTIQHNNEADSKRGALYGAAVGYDHSAGGRIVIGVQGEVTKSGSSYDIDDLLVAGDRFSSKLGRDIYGGVRVGMRAGSHGLIYVGGGYVNSEITSEYRDSSGTLSETEKRDGFRVSLGGEYAKRHFFARLEMRYQDLGDYTVFSTPTGFARTNTQLVAGVGFRF